MKYPDLTHDDIILLADNTCPDCCARGDFVTGPRGGMSVNIACRECGAEFNYCEEGPSFSHRNSEPGKPRHERLATVFGIAVL